MRRYRTRIEDGVLHLETDDGWIPVGTFDDIFEIMGSSTYTVEYDRRQRTQEWLDTDADGELEIAVRDALTDMTFRREFVNDVTAYSMETEQYGLPERTVEFTERFLDILDQEGKQDDERGGMRD